MVITVPDQNDWRFCIKCHELFYNGYKDSGPRSTGVCPAGEGHVQKGFNFVMPYGGAETATAQANWDYCVHCYAMFFSGYGPEKMGVCPSPAGKHEAHPDAFRFVIPHDVAETPTMQARWDFCVHCFTMFFSGYGPGNMGKCPTPHGVHEAHPDAYRFVLPHPIRPKAWLEDQHLISGDGDIHLLGDGWTPNAVVRWAYSYEYPGLDGVRHNGFADFADTEPLNTGDSGSLFTVWDADPKWFNIVVQFKDGQTGEGLSASTRQRV
ncbi:hypothetical protein LQ757_05910 [Agromyces sp. SYSU K20354]|uniref:hypothetical protein n=1 Tax=Agromyces cavernae TaxID=2898659 RepID=UPI001E2E68A8|nr:hypothetical protein [Agromyces cavernae]MCD2441811.1 hypothetical protein [Agromyces cavernae]